MPKNTDNKRKPLFTNGTEVIFATTEHGPSIYSILEGAWMLPTLLQGIREKIWELGANTSNPILAVWFRLKLLQPVYESIDGEVTGLELSKEGHRLVSCVDLLEYEFSMMQQQLSGDTVTDPEKYVKLRKGLSAYSASYLGALADWIALHLPVGGAMLDFCGGSGHYLVHALGKVERSTGLLFDKAPGLTDLDEKMSSRLAIIKGDAKSNHPLFEAQKGTFDLVLMSEILHCMSADEREVAIDKCCGMLKIGGKLIVVEQYPNMRLDLRLFAMTKDGECLSQDRVAFEVQKSPLKPIGVVDSVSHFGIAFIKQELN